MGISWTEPMSRRLVRRRFAENWQQVSSIVRFVSWLWLGALLVCILGRILLPQLANILSWSCILRVAIAIPAIFFVFPIFATLFPLAVHISEKGIAFQMGPSAKFIKYNQIDSVEFVENEGFRWFVVSFKTEKGQSVTSAAVVSPKVCEEEVQKFLVDIGQSHLYRNRPGADS